MFDLPKYGDGICLARLADLLDKLGVDRARLQQNSVVITGSNGKGSTAAMCAAIGRAHEIENQGSHHNAERHRDQDVLGKPAGHFSHPRKFRQSRVWQIWKRTQQACGNLHACRNVPIVECAHDD